MNNGKSFLTLAQQLATHQLDKAALRSAVSRAYYGAFNYGRHLLRCFGFTHIANNVRNHGEVWHYFENCGNADVENAGRKLANLGSDRVKADYQLDNQKFEKIQNVQCSLMNAQNIISEFDNCMASSQKVTAVTQGMKKYAKAISGNISPKP